jgi:hypothetical protein
LGASEWSHRVRYRVDLDEALGELQLDVLATGTFLWDEAAYGARPLSMAALAQIKLDEAFWAEGTHSVLDMDRVIASDDEDLPGTVRPLSATAVLDQFGCVHPTPDDFERAHQHRGALAYAKTWSGLCTVLYKREKPIELAFWGRSGD